MSKYLIRILNRDREFAADGGETLLQALNRQEIFIDAPCGGQGKCGKCRVILEGKEVLACQVIIDRDMDISIPGRAVEKVMVEGLYKDSPFDPLKPGYLLAFDIGTTTVVGYLLDKTDGHILGTQGMLNPQASFGADVISRIRESMEGQAAALTDTIRNALSRITEGLTQKFRVDPADISAVCVVGNPCMQQLFMGIPVDNLAAVPFAPVITKEKIVPASEFIPACVNADFLVVPDISGYVGADTLACCMATEQYRSDETILMLDIGTNGEMILGNKDRMVACSTAAGPALEGADIRFGMRAKDGAIDHVKIEDGKLVCHVIGDKEAEGLCGSGLIDAVAKALKNEEMNAFGRIQNEEETEDGRVIRLTDKVYLNQDDIRKVQLAKGAIAAGIELMMKTLGITCDDIDHVYLAGAFGSYISPESACEIGMIPEELLHRTEAVGNAAGSGAVEMVMDHREFERAQEVRDRIEFLELAALPEFQYSFVEHMNFPDDDDED